MAAFIGTASKAGITLTSATTKTLIQLIAPSNHRVRVLGWGVYFHGTSATGESATVRLLRQTTAGTMSTLTPVKNDDSIAETLQTTAQHTATAEPTAGDVIDLQATHPQGGYQVFYPFGQEPIIGGGDRMGIDCNVPTGVNVDVWIKFEE